VLNQSKNKQVHNRTSQIFTSNDIIATPGVIIAAVLVLILQSNVPDLVIGLAVFLLIFGGAIRIIKLSHKGGIYHD